MPLMLMPIDDLLSRYAGNEQALALEHLRRDNEVARLRAAMLRIHGALETCWARARASQPANLTPAITLGVGK